MSTMQHMQSHYTRDYMQKRLLASRNQLKALVEHDAPTVVIRLCLAMIEQWEIRMKEAEAKQ